MVYLKSIAAAAAGIPHVLLYALLLIYRHAFWVIVRIMVDSHALFNDKPCRLAKVCVLV